MLSTINGFRQSAAYYQDALKTGNQVEIDKAEKTLAASKEALLREDEMIEDAINMVQPERIIREYTYEYNPETQQMEQVIVERHIRGIDVRA